MKNYQEIKQIINDFFGPDYKINVGDWGVTEVKISISWEFMAVLYGTAQYINNEFIVLQKETMVINNISNSTMETVKLLVDLLIDNEIAHRPN